MNRLKTSITSLTDFALRRKGASIAPPAPEYGDLAIDLGTATGLVWSNNAFGHITIQDAMSKDSKDITHIRTLVARRRKERQELLTRADRVERARKEKGLAKADVATEPDDREANVEAVGHAAFECWGRDPNLEVVRAVRGGNVGDVQAYRSVMRHLIRTRYPDFRWNFEGASRTPRILIGVPRNATTRHLEFVKGVITTDLKATPYPVWEQVAAAIGIRLPGGKTLPFRESKSVALADGGGGTFDFAVLNNGRVVHQASNAMAGDDLDDAIIAFLMKEKGLDVGYRTAIAIKEAIGSAIAIDGEDQNEEHKVHGASFETEMPATAKVTRAEIRECMMPVLREFAVSFRRYLQSLQLYGEVHADIMENGFYLTGGTSQLKGLAKYLTMETGLKIQSVENPLTSVVDGLVLMLSDDELLKLGLAA